MCGRWFIGALKRSVGYLAPGSASNRPQREATDLSKPCSCFAKESSLKKKKHQSPSTWHGVFHVSICRVRNYKSLYSCNLMWQEKERRGRGQRAWEKKKSPAALWPSWSSARSVQLSQRVDRVWLPKVKQRGSSQHGSLLSDLQL